jgi:hypothetical protein
MNVQQETNGSVFYRRIKRICGHNLNDKCTHRSNMITSRLQSDCSYFSCPFVNIFIEVIGKDN